MVSDPGTASLIGRLRDYANGVRRWLELDGRRPRLNAVEDAEHDNLGDSLHRSFPAMKGLAEDLGLSLSSVRKQMRPVLLQAIGVLEEWDVNREGRTELIKSYAGDVVRLSQLGGQSAANKEKLVGLLVDLKKRTPAVRTLLWDLGYALPDGIEGRVSDEQVFRTAGLMTEVLGVLSSETPPRRSPPRTTEHHREQVKPPEDLERRTLRQWVGELTPKQLWSVGGAFGAVLVGLFCAGYWIGGLAERLSALEKRAALTTPGTSKPPQGAQNPDSQQQKDLSTLSSKTAPPQPSASAPLHPSTPTSARSSAGAAP